MATTPPSVPCSPTGPTSSPPGRPVGTWAPSVALTEFEQAFTAHPNINAVLVPNDENGAPVITYLKSKGIKAHSFPITGQDATLTGLGNVLGGFQREIRSQSAGSSTSVQPL